MNKGSRAVIALAVIVALLCVSAVAFGAQHSRSKAAAMGAGKMPTARASSTANEAWIYTSDFRTTTPMEISGSIQITASKGAKINQDKAEAVASFTWEDAKYTLHVDCPYPVSGQNFPSRGPLQFMRPVLGTDDLGTLNLPATHAHVAIYGRSTIKKNGEIIAENQPTVVLVTQAIHDSNQALLSSPIADRDEIQLIIPGPLNGQSFVNGFPNGYFYIYWPNVKLTTSGNIKPTPMSSSTPSNSARGPAVPITGTAGPRGTIDVSLTNRGIVKEIYSTPTGLYDLRITNNSSRARGLVITGTDLCCTEYTRFSKIIKPGSTQMFRWYFAPGKVLVRDFLGGRKTSTSYTRVRFGGHSSSFMFE